MNISKNDFRVLCNIAKDLNDVYDKDIDFNEMWEALNDVIENIKEDKKGE